MRPAARPRAAESLSGPGLGLRVGPAPRGPRPAAPSGWQFNSLPPRHWQRCAAQGPPAAAGGSLAVATPVLRGTAIGAAHGVRVTARAGSATVSDLGSGAAALSDHRLAGGVTTESKALPASKSQAGCQVVPGAAARAGRARGPRAPGQAAGARVAAVCRGLGVTHRAGACDVHGDWDSDFMSPERRLGLTPESLARTSDGHHLEPWVTAI